MNFDTKHYHIDGIQIEWGKPLTEVREILEDIEEFNSYGGWPNRRGKCLQAFGLSASEFELRAPHEDRPVMQVIYQIAPIASGDNEIHLPYLTQLEKVLGMPIKSESLYPKVDLIKGFESSSVVFSAKWIFEGIKISLSVYGGTRSYDERFSAAGIFIDWIDEIKAAQPYREQAALFETKMAEQLNDKVMPKKFKLQIQQRPYRSANYDIKSFGLVEEEELRAAQLSLYKRELYRTPSVISTQLKANEIAYYQGTAMDKIVVSNKWDTICLTPNQASELIYWDVLPARGAGYKELLLKELRIEDTRNSSSLLDLIAQVEADLSQKVLKNEAYDD